MKMPKKNKAAAMKVNILPHDIEEDILSRLPVKTIVKFMSVCKSWYSLFLDPRFIDLQQKNNTNNSNLFLLMRLYKSNYLVVTDTSSVVHSRLDPYQFGCIKDYERIIVGSCNGIVCVYSIRNFCNYSFIEYICLWNPALRIIKYIKRRKEYVNLEGERVYLGFGFHGSSNDYKVLRFQKQVFTTAPEKVEIYSSSLDSWRTINAGARNIEGFYITHQSGVYVNEAHQWAVITYSKRISLIISFDMREEVFKEIRTPTECMERSIYLINYNESLAMLAFSDWVDFHDMWVMKVYGSPESWIKLCKIDIRPQQPGRENFVGFIQRNNELIFSRDRCGFHPYKDCRPIGFDIDKSRVNNSSSTTDIEALKDAIEVTTFRESLVLLGTTNLVHHQ